MSYSLQSLTHANDLKYMSAYFCCGSIHVNCFVHCEIVPSSLLISCLLWAGKDFAKTLKTILFTKLTYSICFQKTDLYFSAGFVYQVLFLFLFSSWESYIESMKLFFFKVIYPYNDCLGKTTEIWMLCLVSKFCSVLISFSRMIGI